MKLYFDTSCLVAMLLEEPGAAALVTWRLRAGVVEPAMSDFGRAEVAATLAKLVRMSRLSRAEVHGSLALLDEGASSWTTAFVEPGDIALAAELVLHVELGLRLPDAIHIAMAQRREAGFVTLDRRQHQAALALGLACHGPLSSPAAKDPQ